MIDIFPDKKYGLDPKVTYQAWQSALEDALKDSHDKVEVRVSVIEEQEYGRPYDYSIEVEITGKRKRESIVLAFQEHGAYKVDMIMKANFEKYGIKTYTMIRSQKEVKPKPLVTTERI